MMYLSLPLPGDHTREVGITVDVMYASYLPPILHTSSSSPLSPGEEAREEKEDGGKKGRRRKEKKASRDLPVRYVVRVPRSACVVDIKHALAKLSQGKVDPDACVLADVYNSKVYKWLADGKSVSAISPKDDIWCFCTASTAYIEEHSQMVRTQKQKQKKQKQKKQMQKKQTSPDSSPRSSKGDWIAAEIIHRRPLPRGRVALFDTPFVVHHPRRTPGRWIYEAVWRVVRRFVPRWAAEFEEQRIGAWKRWDDAVRRQARAKREEARRRKNGGKEKMKVGEETETGAEAEAESGTGTGTGTETEPPAAVADGDFSSGGYPFVLSHVKKAGENCSMCQKHSCTGCPFACTGLDLRFRGGEEVNNNNGGGSSSSSNKNNGNHADEMYYLGIDWDPAVLEEFWDESCADAIYEHRSVGAWDAEEERRASEKHATATLDECLELFTSDERLSRNDMWFCPGCEDFRQAHKKFDLWSLPDVLVVHFKRFSAGAFSGRSKVTTLVDFPLDGLDLSRCVQENAQQSSDDADAHADADANDDGDHAATSPTSPTSRGYIYDCVAISNHFGGIGGGHYTAFARDLREDQWFLFDDARVSPVKKSSVVLRAAYIVVYLRRKEGDLAPGQGAEKQRKKAASEKAGASNGKAQSSSASKQEDVSGDAEDSNGDPGSGESSVDNDSSSSSSDTDTPHATSPSTTASSSD
jgi:Ubiquitin carboxyl-terminal hydrolase